MEQRWSPRTHVNLDVDLLISGEEVTGCQTRDIGMGGVFVEMDQATPSKDSLVELNFNLASGGLRTKHRINAKVVRVAKEGVGLAFRDFDTRAFRSLQEVLHYARSRTTQ